MQASQFDPEVFKKRKAQGRMVGDDPGGQIAPARKARLTIAGAVHYQHPDGGQPVTVDLGSSRESQSDEQPYGPRRLTVKETWQKLDLGWLSGSDCYVVLTNEEGKRWQTIPTAAEREAVERKVIGVCFVADGKSEHVGKSGSCSVRPGQPLACGLEGATELYARCQHGEAKCVLIAFPL